VQKQCIDLLLAWAIFPMHNVKGAFERWSEKQKAKNKEPKAKEPKAPLRRPRFNEKKPSFSIPFFNFSPLL
jgi:hypothetical protein